MDIQWEDFFYVDETSESGLRWKNDIKTLKHKQRILVKANDIAGTKQFRSNGKPKSWQVGLKGKTYPVHRIIWYILHGKIDGNKVIDHVDRNPFNNKISNLKLKSIAENNRNLSKNKTNKTGITGIFKEISNSGVIWRATWSLNGKSNSKCFSENKYGELAKELAIQFRIKMIKQLNDKGMNYEDKHGI